MLLRNPSSLAPPGTPGGPCAAATCAHARCAEQRRSAEVGCAVCRAPIGFDADYLDAFGERMHSACLRPPEGARPVLGRFTRPG